MNERVGLPVLEQVEQSLVVRSPTSMSWNAMSLPVTSFQARIRSPMWPDRRQRRHLQLDVDLATRQVVDDRHLVAQRRQVQRRGPAAEAVPAQNEYPHCLPFVFRRDRGQRLFSGDGARCGSVGAPVGVHIGARGRHQVGECRGRRRVGRRAVGHRAVGQGRFGAGDIAGSGTRHGDGRLRLDS